jgi:hypothetical protein
MTGKKVKFAFISNVLARKESYRKRKKGIIKKIREIKILCGIPTCTTRKCHFTGVFFQGVLAAWAVYKLVTAWVVAT